MSRKANTLLAELRDLGLLEGIETEIKGKTTTVKAGSLSSSSTKDDPEEALEAALESMRDKLKGTAAKDRPKWWEATTRTVARRIEPHGDERDIQDVGEGD